MAQISLGNFGNSVAQPGPTVQVQRGDPTNQAMDRVGQIGAGIATDMAEHQTRLNIEEAERRNSNDAVNAALDFELKAKTKAAEIVRGVQSGDIAHSDATALWDKEVSKLHADTIDVLPGTPYREAAVRRAKQVQLSGFEDVAKVVEAANRQQYGADADATLDRLGKLSTLPGANLDSIFSSADSLFPTLAQRAGVPQDKASKILQEWKDFTRFRRAQIDLTAVRRDPEGLDQFITRLDKGDLVGSLDPDKRMALVKEAEGYRWQMDQLQQHQADKREKLAERAVGRAQQQIEAGVPLTADGWLGLRGLVEGTSFAPDFNRLVTSEREVQGVLRMPIDQQEQYLQQRESTLMQQGGTLADRANLQRIKATIEMNKKELEQAPMSAAQRLMGHEFKLLDLADLVSPGGAHRAADVLADRTTSLKAMSRQFGVRVGQKPLFPQEKVALAAVLDMASPSEAVSLFRALRSATDDDSTYRAVMQQIAPDSPVRARAGILAAAGKHITLQDNLISDDVRVPGSKIAQTMLAGEAILNRTKKQKAEDGQARTLFTPPRETFSQSFSDAVGNLYRGRPGAQEQDLQAAYAYYVGRAAELGKTSDGAVDSALAKEAVTATLGAVVNINGQGHVKAPLGMTSSDFKSKAREQFAQEVRRRNLPPSMLNEWPHYGLQDYRRDGTYVLTLGEEPVVDPATRALVVIDLDPPPPSGLRYRSAVDLIPSGGAQAPVNGSTKR
jgi:hypothetical protein